MCVYIYIYRERERVKGASKRGSPDYALGIEVTATECFATAQGSDAQDSTPPFMKDPLQGPRSQTPSPVIIFNEYKLDVLNVSTY